MKVLITESQKKGVILNLIRDKGWEDASSVFVWGFLFLLYLYL